MCAVADKHVHDCRSKKRLLLLDYDGTLMAQTQINPRPTDNVLDLLRTLADDPLNVVFVISGRARRELGDWFSSLVSRA